MKITKTYRWPFMVAAYLLSVFGFGLNWWQGLVIVFLASFYLTLSFETVRKF